MRIERAATGYLGAAATTTQTADDADGAEHRPDGIGEFGVICGSGAKAKPLT